MRHTILQLPIKKLEKLYRANEFPFDKLLEFYKYENINLASQDSVSGKSIQSVLIID